MKPCCKIDKSSESSSVLWMKQIMAFFLMIVSYVMPILSSKHLTHPSPTFIIFLSVKKF